MKKWIIVYLLIVFTVLYMAVRYHTKESHSNYIIIPGKVVGSVTTNKPDSQTMYSEVIAFELNGKEHRFTPSSSSSVPPRIGRMRELIVDKNNPNIVRVRTWVWLEKLTPAALRYNPMIMYMWLIGCGFFAVGFLFSMRQYEFFRRAIIVPGEVTSYEETRMYYDEEEEENRKYYASTRMHYNAVVSYQIDGTVQTITSRFKSTDKPKIGKKVQVGIDPDDMQEVRIREGGWFFAVFAAIGVVCWAVVFAI